MWWSCRLRLLWSRRLLWSPRVDLFLGCRERPAVPVSLTPPPHVTLEVMSRDDDFVLILMIDDGSVTEWLSLRFRERCNLSLRAARQRGMYTWLAG